MKIAKIEITHNLTPTHEEILNSMLQGIVTSVRIFWEAKSKKEFNIKFEHNKLLTAKDMKKIIKNHIDESIKKAFTK